MEVPHPGLPTNLIEIDDSDTAEVDEMDIIDNDPDLGSDIDV